MTTYLEHETEQIPIVKARAMLTKLPEQLAAEDRAVAVTRNGKPVLAVMHWDLFESIVETMDIMGRPRCHGRPPARHRGRPGRQPRPH